MFKNLTIKSRLIFVIGFLSLQMIIGGVIGIVSLGRSNAEMKSLYDDRLVALGQLDQVVRMMTMNQLAVAKAAIDPAEAGKSIAAIEANIAGINKVWTEYMATSLTQQEKALAADYVDARKKFLEGGLLPATAALREQDAKKAGEIFHGPMTQLFEPAREQIDKLMQLQLQVSKQTFEASQSTYLLVRNSCVAGILFGLLMAACVGYWLIRAISHPLEFAVKVADGIASGNLSQQIKVHGRDETSRLMLALKNMNDSLVGIVSQVRTGTDAIATASRQISAGNHDLSSRTEQQASSLEETASSMEELTTTVRQNADNARQANQLVASAAEVAGKGGNVVARVVDTMGSINDSSRKIVDIIGVIDGIAFQTNILALNAAVEAARAGEQGRGFAVVASEVRSLAQRSAAAAKEIKTLIDDSVNKVHAGTDLVNEAGATMQEIVASVGRVTDIMGEITAASQEQTDGIEQINRAIAQMDQVTQQNAALVEQAAAASEAMQEQAGNLAQMVSVFEIHGASVGSALAAPSGKPTVRVQEQKAAARTVKLPRPPKVNPVAGGEWEEF
ncbi:MAG TPA: methyl-accepting chemotaxis protein [Noviherbaspirillum sp.]